MALSKPSLRDIARQLGVSHVTVSMALRNHPRISEARRQEVQQLAEQLGYRPDPMLSSLIAYRNRKRVRPIAATVAWINRWTDPKELRQRREFDAYWQGAAKAADELGYRLEEFRPSDDLSAARLNQILTTRSVLGLLIPPHPVNTTWSDFGLDWERFAVVRFGFSAMDLRAHMIGNDQMRSAELAVGRMAELGYARIGYVSNDGTDRASDGNFRVGYLRGAETSRLPEMRPLVLDHPLVASGAAGEAMLRALESWLNRVRPDALFTSEVGIAAALERLGLRAGHDLGVAATTVRDIPGIDAGLDQNPVEIGRVAVQTLIELVNRHERGTPEYCRRVLVESRWVDGQSLPRRR